MISSNNWKCVKEFIIFVNLGWGVLIYVYVKYIYKLLKEYYCIHVCDFYFLLKSC